MPPGKIFLLILFLICLQVANAQEIKSFSEDPVKFPGDVELLLSDIPSPTITIKIRELMVDFTEEWNTNIYSEEEKNIIIQNANILMKRKLNGYPHLYQYIYIIHSLKNRGNKEAVKIFSQDFMLRIPDMTQRKIEAYLNQYEILSGHNTLYESSTFTWYCSDTLIRLEYDTAVRVIYKKVNITCATRKDTSVILNTSGMFFPNTYLWIGREGKLTWEKLGLSADSVYADLSDYRVNMKFADYEADTVKFINKKYFRTPLYGKLIDKILATPPGPTSTYPQFNSYLKN
jgi:hypothetical protein